MTIQELGSIGELIAAVATIATLVYLALQIKGSAAATRAEARRTMDSNLMETVRRIADDPDLTQLFMLGLAKPESLTPEQGFRFRLYLSHFFSGHETVWKEVRSGTMPQEELDEQFHRSRRFFASAGGETWWRENRGGFSAGFRDYFEARISESKGSKSATAVHAAQQSDEADTE